MIKSKTNVHTFLSGLAISGKTAQNGFTNSKNLTETNMDTFVKLKDSSQIAPLPPLQKKTGCVLS